MHCLTLHVIHCFLRVQLDLALAVDYMKFVPTLW